jgi:hypothetical protein
MFGGGDLVCTESGGGGSVILTADDKLASWRPASVGMAFSLVSDQFLIHSQRNIMSPYIYDSICVTVGIINLRIQAGMKWKGKGFGNVILATKLIIQSNNFCNSNIRNRLLLSH